MRVERVLVANRGEIAVRIIRAARSLGMTAVTVASLDDGACLHAELADEVIPLPGSGAAAFLDGDAILEAARSSGCHAVHPGYGFLAENARFARLCVDAGLVWVGPDPETVATLGDKARARQLAEKVGVAVLPGSTPIHSPADATEFLDALPPDVAIMVKARSGGGGTGLQVVHDRGELAEAMQRCRAAASGAFGGTEVFLERYLPRARHIEVQLLGDATGDISVLGDRDCSLQYRRQKLVEIAPAPLLDPETRRALGEAALAIASRANYRSLGTVEFLLGSDAAHAAAQPYFLEVNPRLQVEHTVTEEVTGIDLVCAQLRVASGATLADLDLPTGTVPHTRQAHGIAAQARINAEEPGPDGTPVPSAGTLAAYTPPGGPGVRVDGYGYAGYRITARYDSLLAKVITRDSSGDLGAVLDRLRGAVREFHITGLGTNQDRMTELLTRRDILTWNVHTGLIDEYFDALSGDDHATGEHRHRATADTATAPSNASNGEIVLHAPVTGTVVSAAATEGTPVACGETVLVLETMKMEHPIVASAAGTVHELLAEPGEVAGAGQPLVRLVTTGTAIGTSRTGATGDGSRHADPGRIRGDLADTYRRHALTTDHARPEAVARRHREGRRTARENLADLCDTDSFLEYGPLTVAAQRSRRSAEDLAENTPADGLVAGIGTVNSELFGSDSSRVIAMSYDYTVLAGTQGTRGHAKKDRMFSIAERERLPVVLFAEGGGGRPGDTDGAWVTGLDCESFARYATLSGTVPLVGIASGRCFAGNAALLGCSDVIIATIDATIGMGGPAMIDGAGLGSFRPEHIGPAEVQCANGVIDVLVEDDVAAVAVARKYLSYFQGPLDHGDICDQRVLREAVPENRKRVYDVRALIETLADTASVLELRGDFAPNIVTSLARVDGRSVGILANDPGSLGGAVDAPAADKAARFLQLCEAFGIPVVSLVDTPGFMVGPDSERAAAVRHVSRMFVTAASLTVPCGTIVLRKAYGLGAQAMAYGGFRSPRFLVSWPTGELGPMGLEGAVRLGYRKELDAITDREERERAFDAMVAEAYERGRAAHVASAFEIDDVIDPTESRRWIATLLSGHPPPPGGRPFVDTW
ncbi:carboxyl transferase domain-containing protein [Haloechinothrix sp. LS1_15]|uniref:carboxyl transferase domain-containing protein n=1 Tax=Haloechinothrix sp. LS1_15 TaxID=2652248 RepID=UPI002944D176|nr:carboxyl transferase domain-containing protein [Haloechinothrix sp. LS1_15]MDV6013498.1 carbamoyl-phosphate synthase large subunit [Haloechinothrix sp. LS1_15]